MNQDIEKQSILFISAEAEPFVRIGGLGDVAGALPQAISQLHQVAGREVDFDIRLAIPYYGCISTTNFKVEKIADFTINSASGPVHTHVFETHLNGLPVYLVDGDPILPAAPVYGKDFVSDAEKFIFFSLACLELPRQIGWKIDLIHANDWHTAIALYVLKKLRKSDPFYEGVKGFLSIHNLPFMGTGSEGALKKYNIPAAKNPQLPKWARILPLPMGMDAADQILTVSPNYAQEIQTPAFGCDLQEFIKTRQDRLKGILNGLDTNLWNPETDEYLQQHFSRNSLPLRIVNKIALHQEIGLANDLKMPLLAYIGRMDQQKGIDQVLAALDAIKDLPWQAVILGTGNPELEAQANALQQKIPDRVKVFTRFDTTLSHRIYAGADMLLMPSRYEPCGLAQMIAMRYGCIPIASAVGGLVNTIQPTTDTTTGTGLLFDPQGSQALAQALKKALKFFSQNEKWRSIQANAMNMNFSWSQSALEYALLYVS